MFARIGGADVGSDGSAIAEAVARATDPLLMGADWSKNLEICDMVDSTPEGQTSLVKMLRRQLRSDNDKTVRVELQPTLPESFSAVCWSAAV